MIEVMISLWDQLFRFPRWWSKRSFFHRVTLQVPVVSVGNLSFGGTGKTPFICALVEYFEKSGRRVAVVSRAYRASLAAPARVKPDLTASPKIYGDEPVMLARRFPHVPVYVGRRKWQAAQLAEAEAKPDVILIDDGFQHWPLVRDLDLVLVDPLAKGSCHVFPFGRLREPVSALRNADFVFVPSDTPRELSSYSEMDGGKIISLHRSVSLPSLPDGAEIGAFCALGNPDRFFHDIENVFRPQKVLAISFRRAFRDHHFYSLTEVGELNNWLAENPRRVLITTEKDWIKCHHFFQDQSRIFRLQTQTELPTERAFRERLEAIFH